MRHLYRGCAGVVLILALSVPVFAGQIPCGGFTEPPPPPAPERSASGDMDAGIAEAVYAALQSVLLIF